MIKKKRFLTIISSIVAVSVTAFAVITMPAPAAAATAKESCEGAGGTWSNDSGCSCIPISIGLGGSNCVAKGSGQNVQDNAIFTWLLAIIRFLSAGVGIAVVGGIVWGGILYLTARDSAAQTQKGVTVITNAIIGLLLYILMFAIVNFLVPGGVLT